MIINVKGNAVEMKEKGEVDALMHCCNALGVMGAGIAKQIKEANHESYFEYHKHCIEHGCNPDVLLGHIVCSDGYYHIIGQASVGKGKQVHYGALAVGFSLIANAYNEAQEAIKLAVPKYIGCGLAGGDWEVVNELLHGFFTNHKYITLYIVEYDNS